MTNEKVYFCHDQKGYFGKLKFSTNKIVVQK